MRKARGTLLGMWWLILRPIIPAVGLIYAFGSVRPVETQSAVPYAVFFLSRLPAGAAVPERAALPAAIAVVVAEPDAPHVFPAAAGAAGRVRHDVHRVRRDRRRLRDRRGHDRVARRAVPAAPRLAHAGGCCRACSATLLFVARLWTGVQHRGAVLPRRDLLAAVLLVADHGAHAGDLPGDLLARGLPLGRSTRSTRWRRSSS